MVFDTNPKVPDYVIDQYEQAARQYCMTVYVSPDLQDQMENGCVPIWRRFAREMALHHLMLLCMRQYGHDITV